MADRRVRDGLPASTLEGLRASGLRFGDRLALGLPGTLASFCHVPDRLTKHRLRLGVQGRTGIIPASRQAGYDLARLRRNGLIQRRPLSPTSRRPLCVLPS